MTFPLLRRQGLPLDHFSSVDIRLIALRTARIRDHSREVILDLRVNLRTELLGLGDDAFLRGAEAFVEALHVRLCSCGA